MSGLAPTAFASYLAAGAGLGILYFVLMLLAVRLHAAQAEATRIVPLYLARLGAAITVFWLIAQQGALPLLLALVGFLIARFSIQRWVGAR